MRTIDYDPITRTRHFFHANADGSFVTGTEQDVEPLVDDNKRALRNIDARARWGEVSRVASIPPGIYFDLVQRGIADDPVAFKKWLNDPDNSVFRTRPGRV